MRGPLDAARLRAIPERVPCVRRVEVVERTGSTNDDARRLGAEGAPDWTVVIAGSQDAGRGRPGRTWYSAPGLGLYVSVLLRPRRPASEAARWTLAAAAAAAEACSEAGAPELTIKWPNDVFASGRKIAGILAELRTTSAEIHELIVGAGFNVDHGPGDFPEPLRFSATSLRMAGARRQTTREELAESWLVRFAGLAAELDSGGWDAVAKRWKTWAPASEGAAVRVLPASPGAEPWTGLTRGIDPTGALRVETATGEWIAVRITESVVPLEG